MTGTIRIVAAVVLDASGRLLLVRKQHTAAFMQPGGKIEDGEDHRTALAREIREELGCEITAASPLGRFVAPAANEPDQIVDADLYLATLAGVPTAQAEIAALCWVDPADPGTTALAQLTRDHVLPLARALAAR